MANSSDVVANAQALATDYNKLRADVLNAATGHNHEDPDGKRLAKNALRFTANKFLLGAGAAEPTEVSPGAALTVAETEVFSGTSPTAWADLDLSGTIGANPALVLLKILYPVNTQWLAVRKNGDADDFFGAGTPQMAGCAIFETYGTDKFYVVLVATDNAGIIEWISTAAQAGTTIDIIAYIK